jgi:1-acyl-sn-glycerol-3-phosphate acyltransferase
MAIDSGAPIIPVAMFNTAEIQPTGQVVPKVRRVEMVFGEPMYFTGDSTDQALLRSATNQIMEKIAELSKQEYVPNMYASEAKDAIKNSKLEEDQIESDEE